MKKEEEREERGLKRGEMMEDRGRNYFRKVFQRRKNSPKSSEKGIK